MCIWKALEFSAAVLGLYITPHKRLGLRAKKPGNGLIYAELFELLAVLCVSILVCVQAANFIRKTKLSVITWGCHILSATGTTLSTTGNHIHTIARSSRQAEVSNRGWSPGDMLPLKSTLNRTHTPWFSLCRQLTSQELRVFRKYSWPPRFKEPADITNDEVVFAWLEKSNSWRDTTVKVLLWDLLISKRHFKTRCLVSFFSLRILKLPKRCKISLLQK